MQPIEPNAKTASDQSIIPSVEHPDSIRRRKIRHGYDNLLRAGMFLGGYSVIVTIALIFFFLLLQVWPLLQEASIDRLSTYILPEKSNNESDRQQNESLYLAMDEQAKIAVQLGKQGQIHFFSSHNGETQLKTSLLLPDATDIHSFSASESSPGLVIYGLSNGAALVLRHTYKVTYQQNRKIVSPVIEYPLGKTPLIIDSLGHSLARIAIEKSDEQLTIVALTDDKRLIFRSLASDPMLTLSPEHNLSRELDDSSEASLPADSQHWHSVAESEAASHNTMQTAILNIMDTAHLSPDDTIQYLLLNKSQENVFLISRNMQGETWLQFYHIKNKAQPELSQTVQLSQADVPVTAVRLLAGGISLLVGKQNGEISQWFVVNRENIGFQLTEIRRFGPHEDAISHIIAEPERKGFLAIDKSGQLGIYHTTSQRNLLLQKLSDQSVKQLAVNQRANHLVAEDVNGNWSFWAIDNEHPEVSWQSLWGKVWYESYSEPAYVWQSSSASNDFEPKFSLTPLALGTLKAAFYAMLFATPLAVMGAIYTAYFMNARMRNVVKPTIEIMEALPTVIIGFLAGLWLAPLVDAHLFATLALIVALPPAVLLMAWLWHRLGLDALWQRIFKKGMSEGWEALILIPLICAFMWLIISWSGTIEHWLLGGTLQNWLENEQGISFDQRNSIIVGIAMGFAVIPTIFSITEDAVFNVPAHLSNGSMALGATRWQTLIQVVILTASPAIFSAIMIGFGRAIGETMIVLMATGNTPIMDMSIFQGMRTLSANIAIEIPESEMASSHYRILFLAALILFLFTFFFNTIAEIVRQRLRRKYSKL